MLVCGWLMQATSEQTHTHTHSWMFNMYAIKGHSNSSHMTIQRYNIYDPLTIQPHKLTGSPPRQRGQQSGEALGWSTSICVNKSQKYVFIKTNRNANTWHSCCVLCTPAVLAADWTEGTCGMSPLDTRLRGAPSLDILASENHCHHNSK